VRAENAKNFCPREAAGIGEWKSRDGNEFCAVNNGQGLSDDRFNAGYLIQGRL
jgi:hypothetical protein